MNTSVPMCECPSCHQEFQLDDYYEVSIGWDFECPKCDKTMYVLEKDVQIIWTLVTADEWAEEEAKQNAARKKALEYATAVIAKAKTELTSEI